MTTVDVTASGGNLPAYNGTVTLNLASDQNITNFSSTPLSGTLPANASNTYVLANAADNTAPTVTAASVNGTTLTVTFSEAMGSAKAANSAWAVSVAGSSRSVSSYTLSGSTAVLTLASAVAGGQTVTLGYNKPGSGDKLQDAAGNDLATFSNRAVTNNSDQLDGNAITLSYRNNQVTFSVQVPGARNTHYFMAYKTVNAIGGCTANNNSGFTEEAASTLSGQTYSKTITGEAGKYICIRRELGMPSYIYGTAGPITYDTTAPTITGITRHTPSSTPTNADSLTWRVSFSEAVTGVDDDDFEIVGNPAQLGATSLGVVQDGSTNSWDLTLSGGDLAGFNGTVTIGLASAQNITDSAGNALSRTLPAGAQTRYTVDNTAPTVTGAGVDGTALTVTFSENMAGDKAADSAWAVSVAGSARSVSSYTLSGSTAVLTLASAVTAGQSVTLGYTKPGSGDKLQDAAGNELATLSGQAVTNSTRETTAPTITGITRHNPSSTPTNADSLTWRVSFSEAVTGVDGDDFEIVGNPAQLGAASLSVVRDGSTNSWDVTVSGGDLAGYNGTVTIGLASAQNIADSAGNALSGTLPSGAQRTYTVDNTAPTVTAAGVDGTALTVTFSESMGGAKAADSAWAVSVAGSARSVSSYTLSGSTAVLTLAGAVTTGESVTLGYTQPSSGDKLQDAAGNDLASLSGQAVTNNTRDTTAPTVTAAGVDGATLTVTFSEAMGSAKAADSAWAVSVAGSARSVSSYTLSGSTATLTLASAVTAGQSVTLGYTKPSSGDKLQDAAGNELATLSGQAVTNSTRETTAPTITGITRHNPSSTPTNADSLTWRVSFSEAVTGVDDNDFEIVGNPAQLGAASLGVVRDGSTNNWDVTLSGGDLAGFNGTVTIGLASAQNIADSAGNALSSTLPAGAQTRYTVDNTAPTVTAADVDGTTLTVTFSENMGSSKAANSAWAVSVAGSARSVSSYTLSGSTAVLTLASAVTAGQSVTLGYTKPSSGDKLQDAAGNELATFSNRAVTNNTRDTTAPTVTATVVDGATLTVTFSEAMGSAKAANSAWAVSVAGSTRSVSSYTISGSTATLTLASTVTAGQSVTLGYTKPSSGDKLQDAAGNELATLSGQAVTNSTLPLGDIQVTPVGALTIDEGDSTGTTLSVSLSAAPSANVTVSLTKTNSDVTLSSTSLTFTATDWSTAQSVTVTAAEDADADDETDTITFTATGGITASAVTKDVTITDDDKPKPAGAIEVTPAGTLTIAEGGSGTLMVRLSAAPNADVTVTLAKTNDDVTLSGSTLSSSALTFTSTNYSTEQTVTVTAADDSDSTDDTDTITFTAAGGITASAVTKDVSITDDDTGATLEAEQAAAAVILAEVARSLLPAASGAISQRYSAARTERTATVAGRQVALDRSLAQDLAAGFAARAGVSDTSQQGRFAGDTFGAERHSSDWLGGIPLDAGRPLRSADARTSGMSGGAGRSALLSDFSYALNAAGGGAGWSIWGRFDTGEFSGANDGVEFDSSRSSVWFGADRRSEGGMLSGVAYSSSGTDADYTLGRFGAALKTDLTLVLPYAEAEFDSGATGRAMLGIGSGEATITQTDKKQGSADLSVYMLTAGGSWPTAWEIGSASLSWSGDFGYTSLSTTGSTLPSLDGLSVSSMQLRGGMELTFEELGYGWKTTPHAALLMRLDAGDGVTGTGFEFTGGMMMSSGSSERFSVDVNLRTLIMHSAEELTDWGMSIQFRLRPFGDGSGLGLALGPHWGAPEGDDLLDRDEAFRLDEAGRQSRQMRGRERGIAADLGYGLRAFGGMLTPYSEYRLTSGDYGSIRQVAGVRFSNSDALHLSLFSERHIARLGETRSRLAVELQKRY